MDTPDRTEGPMPARQAHVPPAVPPFEFEDDPFTDASSPPKKFSARLAWRAVRRHWGQALLLWAVGSVAVMALAYHGIKPTYEAVAQFRIEPGEQALFAKNVGLADFGQYRESQVTLVTSPVVLSNALAKHPELMRYPRLGNALDAEAEMRQVLRVQTMRNTNQIQVAMSAPSAQEAADIVNAVVEAYLDFAQEVNDQETKQRIDRLKEVQDQSQREVDLKRQALEKLREEMGNKVVTLAKEARFSVAQYEEWNKQLMITEVEKLAVQDKLDKLRGLRNEFPRTQDPEQVRQAASNLFQADPRVTSIQEHLSRATSGLNDAQRRARDSRDPARVRFQRMIDDDRARLARLWKQLWPAIQEKLRSGAGDDGGADRTIGEVESHLADLTAREKILKEKLREVHLKNEAAGGDALKIEFARSDLSSAEAVLQQVQAHLKQQEFEAKGTIARRAWITGLGPRPGPSQITGPRSWPWRRSRSGSR